jgi:hypothetical protein
MIQRQREGETLETIATTSSNQLFEFSSPMLSGGTQCHVQIAYVDLYQPAGSFGAVEESACRRNVRASTCPKKTHQNKSISPPHAPATSTFLSLSPYSLTSSPLFIARIFGHGKVPSSLVDPYRCGSVDASSDVFGSTDESLDQIYCVAQNAVESRLSFSTE